MPADDPQEERLRIERELEDMYERAPCGYHSVDAQGVIVRINATWLDWLGYSREEVVGRMRHPQLMTPESARRFDEEAFPRFLREGRLQDAEFEYRRKDGSTFFGQLNATSVYDAQGRYVMSRSTVFDVTARKQAEDRLAQLNKELEGFSYAVSHDLRAPLRAIEGYARMLEEQSGRQLDAEGRRLLGVVRASSRRMGRLIEDLLELARLGQLEPVKTRVDMTAVLQGVVAELAPGFPRAVVTVQTLPAVLADPALMRLVWVHLLGNALKFSASATPPRIEIGAASGAGGAQTVYWIRDNGAGFDMRHAGKLFAVFQRLHRQDDFPGSGAGLAIVQRIIARHGGRVWAEATPGAGARFSFSVPST
jgi:PAS domain S-box-containing protein